MTDTAHLLAELSQSGALREGHFRLSSGLHSERYIQCAKLLEEPERAARVGGELAARLKAFGPDSVLSPALGGIVIGFVASAALGVPFRFCERKDGVMRLRRGFALGAKERVAVVEDVVTTGGSAAEAGRAAMDAGAEVVAYASIIDRSGGTATFDAPFVRLLEIDAQAVEATECAQCAAGTPLQAPGSRAGLV